MKAIIAGVTGQDGFYMAKLLLARGVEVLGLTSDLQRAAELRQLLPEPALQCLQFDYAKTGAMSEPVKDFAPDLIFNFAAKATGQGMFDAPYEMNRLNGAFVLDILEAIRDSGRPGDIRFCQASSSEMFGEVTEPVQSEQTPFRPKSPYGAAKVYGHNMVGVYRAAYGLHASSAILYNHEGVRRSTRFVTKKIAHGAAAIRAGAADSLTLGALDIRRDWGFAPEYVEAMHRMVMADGPGDYVIATGRLNTIERVAEIAFERVGLDYRDFIRLDDANRRAVESVNLCGDPGKAARELGWRASVPLEQIIGEMVDHELAILTAAQ